jgi:hypothetical protein
VFTTGTGSWKLSILDTVCHSLALVTITDRCLELPAVRASTGSVFPRMRPLSANQIAITTASHSQESDLRSLVKSFSSTREKTEADILVDEQSRVVVPLQHNGGDKH